MHIGDIVNIKNLSEWDDDGQPFWMGKVTEIREGGRIITVQDKGINFAEINVDDLLFKDNEYWEK